jgi:CMP-N-acetylneuraminic acid synthetase
MLLLGDGWAFLKGVPLIGPRTAMVPMPESRICDINVEEDWLRAERMFAALKQEAACAAS